ncbi:cdc42 effector protein 3 [Salmo salar]|uniref:Cdc42 effector protein 3-like n=1 Tax=Salmo salar TaxID=8030 RepID=A0A1S3RUG1_SALSA|nr:cdc42 effector protein 3-like [Salmo salar]XP_014055369.1 cdc42 effector protein 3-like [Salmo salar]|eukprot:XP_014055359.1 PREDICTED: cdc42 effector protein 3-like [Salmo salar]
MPAKAPIYLKSTNSKKGKKCRLRDILSPDMISPPLGDFRHTIHIGKGGERDAFGDMSFLQGKFELLPGKGEVFRPQYGVHNEFLRANSASDAQFTETPSPVLKNAISLPSIGGCQALTLPLLSTNMFSMPVKEPLDDMVGRVPTPPLGGPDGTDKLEILEMETMLCSIEVLSSNHTKPPTEVISKPDVLLDLIEKPENPKTKKVFKSNYENYNIENGYEKPTPTYYINGNSNGTCNGNGGFNGNSNGIFNGNEGFNGNGNCNGFGSFNNDITLCYEKALSDCNGDWVDRDSGVDEGRICDIDFEFCNDKRVSQDSISHITGSLLSLELDLGPSILDDVLNIMGDPKVKRP